MATQGLCSAAINTMTLPQHQRILRQKRHWCVELVEITNQPPGEASAAGKMLRQSPKEVCTQVRCAEPQEVEHSAEGDGAGKGIRLASAHPEPLPIS